MYFACINFDLFHPNPATTFYKQNTNPSMLILLESMQILLSKAAFHPPFRQIPLDGRSRVLYDECRKGRAAAQTKNGG